MKSNKKINNTKKEDINKKEKDGLFRYAECYNEETNAWEVVDAYDLKDSDRHKKYRCIGCGKPCFLCIYQPEAKNRFKAKDHKNCKCTLKVKHITIIEDETTVYDRDAMLKACEDNSEEHNVTKVPGPDGPTKGTNGDDEPMTIEMPKVKANQKTKLKKLKPMLDRQILKHENFKASNGGMNFSSEIILPEKKNEILIKQPESFEGLLILDNDEPKKIGLPTVQGKIWRKDYWTKDPKNALHILISIPNNRNKNLQLISSLCGQKSKTLKDKEKLMFVFGRFKKKIINGVLTYEIKLDDQNICFCMPNYTEEQIEEWIKLIRE